MCNFCEEWEAGAGEEATGHMAVGAIAASSLGGLWGQESSCQTEEPTGPRGTQMESRETGARARGLQPREGCRAWRPVGGLWVWAGSMAGVRFTASLGQLCALEAAASACPGEQGSFGQVWAEKPGEGSTFTAEQLLSDEFLGVRGRVSSGSLGHWPEEGG